MAEYSSTLTIEELDVGSGRRARVLVLTGNGLPHQGTEWGSENSLPTTYYPGNPEATQQLLVRKDVPFAWEGEWKRTLLPNSGTTYSDETGTVSGVISPAVLRDALDAMLGEGALLRVTWATAGDSDATQKIVRLGRAKSWSFPHTRAQDIGWKVEFQWKSRGARVQKVATTRNISYSSSLSATQAAMLAWAKTLDAKLKSAIAGTTGSAISSTIGQLEALVDLPVQIANQTSRSVQYAVGQLAALANIATQLRTVPAQVQNQAVDLATDITAQVNQFVDQQGQVPAELASNKSGVQDVIRGSTYLGQSLDAAQLVALESVVLASRFRAFVAENAPLQAESSSARATGQVQRDIIAVHVTVDGDTPINVSTTYYGTPDRAADILRANRLPLHQATFAPGRPLVIPVASTTTNGSSSAA